MTETTTIKEILPCDIIFDAGTQARVRTDIKTCQSYIESMKDGVEFPPLDVFNDGTSPKYVLGDGFHRLQSHCSFRPNEPIKCRVHLGTVSDAIIFAAGANATHGFRRSNEDKRKAVKMILLEPQCVTWSDRKIADHVQVGKTLVFNVRTALESGGLKDHMKGKRTGKDGKTYPARRNPAGEAPEPESHIRTNADGKTVNTKGFDYRDHRRCDECGLWSLETGLCARDDSPQPSWTPACSDWRKRHGELQPEKEPAVERLQTRSEKETTRTNKPKSPYVRQDHQMCKLYPENAELSAIEIRHVMGEEFLLSLQKAIKLVMNED